MTYIGLVGVEIYNFDLVNIMIDFVGSDKLSKKRSAPRDVIQLGSNLPMIDLLSDWWLCKAKI